jgi:hypothetical protein
MTDLISTPPAPASPNGSKVTTGDWWPDIDVNAVRAGVNLGGTTIAHERLVNAISFGLVEVTDQLAAWQAVQIAAGKTSLALVDTVNLIDETPRPVVMFLRAVTMLTAAELADRQLDLTARSEGIDREDERRCMADDFRRSAVRAIRTITGETGTMVDLI